MGEGEQEALQLSHILQHNVDVVIETKKSTTEF